MILTRTIFLRKNLQRDLTQLEPKLMQKLIGIHLPIKVRNRALPSRIGFISLIHYLLHKKVQVQYFKLNKRCGRFFEFLGYDNILTH